MTARFGIELSPNACRIVSIDAPAAWSRQPRDTRVQSFDLLPASAPETRDRLRSLRRQTAAAVVWTTASEHRQVVVTGGSYESMRAEALDSLVAAGVQTQGIVADIAPLFGAPRRGVRQPVVVSLAPASELSAQVQLLREAGIRLRAVTTPAVALASLEDTATCIALVRDTALVAARNLPWGYGEEHPTGIVTRPRAEIASRLGDAVTAFVAEIGGDMRHVGQVCVCGGLQELRSMTAPLMEQLDLEVEPLDSLLGIDAAHLPEPADEFRERSAELRVAWAVAADWPPPINLLRARRRQESKRMLSRVAVAAGVVAGVAAGWRVEQSQWWQSTAPKPVARTASNTDTRRPDSAAASRVAPPPDVGPKLPPPPPDVGPQLPPVVSTVERPPAPAAVAVNKPPGVLPPPPDVGPKLPPAVSNVERAAPPAVAANKPPIVLPSPPPPDVGPKLPPAVSNVERATPPAVAAIKPPVVLPSPPPPDVGPKFPAAPAVASRSVPPTRGVTELESRTQPNARPASPAVTKVEPPGARKAEPPAARKVEPPTRVEPAVPRPAPPPARVEPPAVRNVERPPVRVEPAPATVERPAENTVERGPRAPVTARARPAPPQPAPLPFDAVLGTILYSPDRKLAIIDGLIVGPGDIVRGARVIDITPNAVMLRDSQGRLRRLALAGGR
jgi:hypothetical protein